jgi:hypothetical protein
MADALYNAILGEEAPVATAKKSDVPSIVNPNNVGNIRPVGSSTGFQQYKTPEEGIKAVDDQLRIYGEKHGVKTLRQAISRWAPPSENDTESYIKDVATRSGINPDAEIDFSNPVVRHLISAPLISHEKGIKNIIGAKSETKLASNDPLYNAIMGNEVSPPNTAEQVTKQPQANKPLSFIENRANRLAQEKPSDLLGGIGETLYGAVANPITSLIGAGKGVIQSIPEAIRTGQAPEPIGEKIATEYIEKHKVEPKTETGKAINKFISEIPEKITGSSMSISPLPETAVLLATPKEAVVGKAKGAVAEMQQQYEKQVPRAKVTVEAAPESTLTGVGSAKVETNPYSSLTGEEKARGEYPVVKLSKTPKDVPKTEQQTRSQIATEILGPDAGVREGVVTANENTLRNEHTLAKQSRITPEGEVLKEQIAKEQNALSDYAKKRIENTGADQLLQDDYERGERINNAFAGEEGATGFLKKAKNALYEDARANVGNNPIATSHVNSLFENPQFQAGAGLRGNEGVLKSAQSLIKLAKETGFEDEFGNKFAPNSVGAWDAVRKSLNAEWTPTNATMIRKINQAIDKDIASAGGADLLKKADALHQAEKELFGSKGIKKLFGEVDSNGVQTATAFDQIPKRLNSMPFDEWRNIWDAADKFSRETIEVKGQQLKIPPELREAAQAAKNEMSGSIAREIYQAGGAKVGVWNQNSVNNVLNARARKIKYAFTPEEQKAFHTLNYGGHIMPGVHAYEGAGLQTERVGLISSRLPAAGEVTGAFIGGAPGAFVGRKVGEFGQKFTTKSAAEKRAKNLEKSMKENAKLGTKISDIGKQ